MEQGINSTTILLAVLGTLVGGGGIAGFALALLKFPSEKRKNDADTIVKLSETVSSLTTLYDTVLDQLTANNEMLRQLSEQTQTQDKQIKNQNMKIGHLRSIVKKLIDKLNGHNIDPELTPADISIIDNITPPPV